MTEEEAKTKACHAAERFDPGNGDTPKCCGSACAAWRWAKTGGAVIRLKPDGGDSYAFTADDVSAFEGRPHEFRTERAAANGYCGLAGAPQ